MKMKDYILFDLDGTLTDPGEGITNSVAYALCKYGIEVSDKKSLECFIGPPLHESFCKYFGFSTLQAFDAVTKYREYYHDRGIFENKVYEGIPEMLCALKQKGKTLIMATSKPTVFAKRIAEHYDFAKYFDIIIGSELNGQRVDKAEVIEEAIRLGEIGDRQRALMVGDRLHDICGAKKNSLDSVGVLYGYGSEEELSEAGADKIVSCVSSLSDYLLNI